MARSSTRRARLRRAARTLALLAFALLSTGALDLEFDEFKCEAAMAHLARCCPAFVPTAGSCERTGCTAGRLPDLSVAESDCILALDCDDVRARKLCETVATLPANTYESCPNSPLGSPTACSGPTLYEIHSPVCQ